MIILAFVIAVCAAYIAGYCHQRVSEKVKDLETIFKESHKQVAPSGPKLENTPTILDPDDIRQRVQFEHDEAMRKLNAPQMPQ